jgi:hypothetical protein
MVLKLEQIRQITFGTAYIIEDNDRISFNRFTAEQSGAYKEFRNNEFYHKTFAAAGIRMAFRTDSRKLSFEYKFSYGSSRLFGWFDVYENGIKLYLLLDTGSSVNLKPELVMEAFYDYLGLSYEKFAWQVHRLEVYTKDTESDKLAALDQVER